MTFVIYFRPRLRAKLGRVKLVTDLQFKVIIILQSSVIFNLNNSTQDTLVLISGRAKRCHAIAVRLIRDKLK